MTAIIERLGLDKLNDDEKREVIDALSETLPESQADEDWDEEETEFIRKRIAASDANPNGGILWRELKKQWAENS